MGLFRVAPGTVSCFPLVHDVHLSYSTNMSETVIREVRTLLASNIPLLLRWTDEQLLITQGDKRRVDFLKVRPITLSCNT